VNNVDKVDSYIMNKFPIYGWHLFRGVTTIEVVEKDATPVSLDKSRLTGVFGVNVRNSGR
jgi:hypothetical protein